MEFLPINLSPRDKTLEIRVGQGERLGFPIDYLPRPMHPDN